MLIKFTSRRTLQFDFLASPSPPDANTSGEGWANFESATTSENSKPASSNKNNEEVSIRI